jgi:hypothetical protein
VKIALVTIATGEKYHQYIRPLFISAQKFFSAHDFYLWTDSNEIFFNAYQFKLQNEGFPGTTLHRYHTFLQQREQLSSYDYIFYTDIDMEFVAPIKEEDIFSDGITATLHPGYINRVGTPERNPASRAYIPLHANNKYFCGGFNGGLARSFIWMAEHIKECIDIDAANGITAVWHDESHLNSFLYYNNPPARVLGPEYCYPEGCNGVYAGNTIGSPKLIALTKKT